VIYIVGENLTRAELDVELSLCVAKQEVVGLDTETMGIDPRSTAPASGVGRIACWSISTPRYGKVFLWGDQLEYFRSWLESKHALKVGHNIFGFDKHMFANHGITLRGVVGCTQRLSRLLYCCKMRSHGLKDLAFNWLGIEMDKMKDLFQRPAHSLEFVQEVRTRKGVKEPLEYRESKRKVGDVKGVPTLFATGERGKFGKKMEFIPLTDIPSLYPERLQALYLYATLDAEATRLLYHALRAELEKVEWQVKK
jgi:hypothetical protein